MKWHGSITRRTDDSVHKVIFDKTLRCYVLVSWVDDKFLSTTFIDPKTGDALFTDETNEDHVQHIIKNEINAHRREMHLKELV